MLAVILGQGESSRLELGVKRKGLANDAHAYAYTPQDSGLFALDATLEPATTAALRVTQALLAEALRLRDEPCDAAKLDAAKSMLEADAIYQRETVQGLARRLGFLRDLAAGGLDEEARHHRRIGRPDSREHPGGGAQVPRPRASWRRPSRWCRTAIR